MTTERQRVSAEDEPIDLDIAGRQIRVTHPRRVIWPSTGTTKRELIDYLLAAAPVLLRHLRGRATMLWRFPEGVDGPGWFQAECRSRPPWVRTYELTGRRGDALRYCVIDEPATLAWLANLGTIELHPHGWEVERPLAPTHVVFDLDPGPPASLAEAARVATMIGQRLRSIGLEPVVKTSGSLGLHLTASLDPGETFVRAKTFTRQLAEELAASEPDLIIARSDRLARAGLVYIDWIQNDRNRQLIAPYSPRATDLPRVSTPLRWSEVVAAAAGDLGPLRPTLDATLRRIDRFGDLWTPPGQGGARLP